MYRVSVELEAESIAARRTPIGQNEAIRILVGKVYAAKPRDEIIVGLCCVCFNSRSQNLVRPSFHLQSHSYKYKKDTT
ncbi:hypothetical protein [Paenibacillus phytorum]|uniref:hypothetical protein n=1 Tax=Paenibacillus phytorum TaxID=2654977 RepID=UPI0014909C00|nr:hypothetical protein [Paenibacillus phytorum]